MMTTMVRIQSNQCGLALEFFAAHWRVVVAPLRFIGVFQGPSHERRLLRPCPEPRGRNPTLRRVSGYRCELRRYTCDATLCSGNFCERESCAHQNVVFVARKPMERKLVKHCHLLVFL